MCTQGYHDELRRDWIRFEEATTHGFIQHCAGFYWETRHCRHCHSSLAHPRDLERYGIGLHASVPLSPASHLP